MIFKAKNGAQIIERIYENENEAIEKLINLNHALVIVKIEDDYWVKYWHEEYGGLYGITLSREYLQIIEEKRQDNDEIGAIGLYSELKARAENIDEINEKLLEFY